ncbi:hypothetical protein B0H14DRAFT_2846882, partial [Mycena olivaceomarginata]
MGTVTLAPHRLRLGAGACARQHPVSAPPAPGSTERGGREGRRDESVHEVCDARFPSLASNADWSAVFAWAAPADVRLGHGLEVDVQRCERPRLCGRRWESFRCCDAEMEREPHPALLLPLLLILYILPLALARWLRLSRTPLATRTARRVDRRHERGECRDSGRGSTRKEGKEGRGKGQINERKGR